MKSDYSELNASNEHVTIVQHHVASQRRPSCPVRGTARPRRQFPMSRHWCRPLVESTAITAPRSQPWMKPFLRLWKLHPRQVSPKKTNGAVRSHLQYGNSGHHIPRSNITPMSLISRRGCAYLQEPAHGLLFEESDVCFIHLRTSPLIIFVVHDVTGHASSVGIENIHRLTCAKVQHPFEKDR